MADFSIANPFWQHNFPEYELEGLWSCAIRDVNPTMSNDSPILLKNRPDLKHKIILVDDYIPL